MLDRLRNKDKRIVVGLMSGTSLDGIDAAVVEISGLGLFPEAKLLHYEFVPYEGEIQERIKGLCSPDSSNVQSICCANFWLAELFAKAALTAVKQAGYGIDQVDLIGSHGQTVWHQPIPGTEPPWSVASTLQIGDISILAERTGRPVVGDFRTADMAVGGQGAPLVPFADYICYRDTDKGRILQNIGGIANCTAIPAGAGIEELVAFDTGPGNMVIDQAVYLLSDGDKSYDDVGAWAAQGQVEETLLANMLGHPYFAEKPVKTTGRELFGQSYTRFWLQKAEAMGMPQADILATFTALTAHSIARSYEEFIFPHMDIKEIVVSGGGAHNQTLLAMLKKLLPNKAILSSEELGISVDAKEALAFALLADRFIQGKPANVPAATGARRSAVLGKLALP